MSGARVLVIDDDPGILLSVRRALEVRSYQVVALDSGEAVVATVASFRPDVILLDLMLPDIDGITVCRSVRPTTEAAIIVLSAIGDESKKVQALDEGADDYLTKPFGMEELFARIRVALRHRGTNPTDAALATGPVRLDLAARTCEVAGKAVHLTPREFDLLRLLMEHHGRVLTHHLILGRVWGAEYTDDVEILRTFVHQLRQKLRSALPAAAAIIITDPGVGYRIDSSPSS